MSLIKTKQNIPQGWCEEVLASVAVLNMGQSPTSDSYNQDEKGLPFFQGKADFSKISNKPVVRQWTSAPTKISEAGDILITVRAPVGDLAINDRMACIGRGLASIRAKENNVQSFIFYVLQSLNEELNAKAQGSTFTAINTDALGNIAVIMPPAEEQQKIAEILGAVDEDIAKTQEVIDAIEKLKRGLMQQLFTRGIGHTKFKETKIGNIPEKWDVIKIKDSQIKIIDGDRGINYPKAQDFTRGGYCLFLSNKDIKNDKFVFSESQFISREKDEILRAGKLQREDVILTTRGTVGNVAFYDDTVTFLNIRINSGMLILRAFDNIEPIYLYHLMKSCLMKEKYKEISSGSAQPQLPIKSFEQAYIPIPPEDEQREIADILSAVDEKILVNKKLKEKLTLLKKGLMQDLLSGKVRVKNSLLHR